MSSSASATTEEKLKKLLQDFDETSVHIDLTEWAVDVLSHISTIKTNHYERLKFKSSFMSLTTHEERIKFCFNNELLNDKLYDVVDEMVAYLPKLTKDGDTAERCKNRGNKKFAEEKYDDALKEYTEAIICAPHGTNDSCLALAYGNRSATLFKLEKYSKCLSDIEEAQKHGYPEDLLHKLLIRKAKCLKIDGQVQEAKNVLNQAYDLADKNKQLDDDATTTCDKVDTESGKNKAKKKDWNKVLKEIKNLMSTIETYGNFMKEPKRESFLLGRIAKMNAKIPHASASLRLETTAKKGRMFVANTQIETNTDLICEEPIVSLLDKEKYTDFCYVCFTKLDNVSHPCPKCTNVRFCSPKCCLSSKASAHLKECKYVPLLDMTEKFRLALKLLLEHGLDKGLEAYRNWEPKPFTGEYSADYNSVLSLMDHADDMPFLNLLAFSLNATFYVILLRDELKLIPAKDTSTAISCGALLLKHILQTITNSVAVLRQEETESGVKMDGDKIGVALYPTMSLLNHSCDANTASIFCGNKVTIRSVRRIQFAEEVTLCYGPNVDSNYTKSIRLRELKRNYFFDCDCSACRDSSEIFMDALLCPACKGPVLYNEDNYTYQCKDCKETDLGLDIKAIVDKITEYVSAFDSATRLIQLGLKEAVEDSILTCHEWFTEVLHPLNRRVIRVKKELCSFYEDTDMAKAIEFGKDVVRLLEVSSGPDSLEYTAALIHLTYLRWKSAEASKEKAEEKSVNDDSRWIIEKARKLVQKLQAEGIKYVSVDFDKFNDEFKYISERMYEELKF